MHRRLTDLAMLTAGAVFLVGCETTPTAEETAPVQEPAPVETAGAGSSGATGATAPIAPAPGFQGDPLDDPASLLSNRTIYFDFDSSEILPEHRAAIEAHAGYLADNPSASVTLEGHTDERGTREYNIALGERRGNSVRDLMTLVGGSSQQLRVISYGEERPAAEGHDEAAWALNRRVEIIYRTR